MSYERYPEDRDGYGVPSNTPYPSSYDPYPLPDPRQYQNLGPQYQPPNDAPSFARSRASSNAVRPNLNPNPEILRQQPLYDAVSNAFDNSAAANALPEEVIRQITEQVRSQVIDSLKREGISGTQQAPAPAPAPPPPASAPPEPYATYPPPPPTAIPRRESPLAREEYIGSPHQRGSGHYSPSPSREERTAPIQAGYSVQEPYSGVNGDGRDRREYPKKEDINISERHGDRSDTDSMPRRPTIPSTKTDEEPTTLEKIWQPLFDTNGEPTERLSQFLRGLALHIIDDYEPKKSLVISPAKLKKFYEDVRLSDETYPWHNIFRLSNSTIGKIYRDLKVEHFYVQERVSDPPTVPALTPVGFQRWMTLHIQAHPQAEFERLAQAVRHMPINNADNPKERFPKELSRRLLPKYDDLKTRQYCSAALSADGQISIPAHTSFPAPPPQAQPMSQSSSSFGSREPAPYGTSSQLNSSQSEPHDSAIQSDTDEENHKPSVQIERERKPYVAKEGMGKVYENDKGSSSRTLKPEPGNSTTTRSRPSSMFVDRNDVGNHSDGSRTSEYATTGRSRGYSKSSRHRPRSPTISGYGKSESSVDGIPRDYYASNMYPGEDDRYSDRERRDRSERRDRERDDRDRWLREERERRDRERDEREEFTRRLDEEERMHSRYDGDPISRRSTVDSGYPGPGMPYGSYPLGTGERRYG